MEKDVHKLRTQLPIYLFAVFDRFHVRLCQSVIIGLQEPNLLGAREKKVGKGLVPSVFRRGF
jgi:hypothetical protein